MNKKEMDLLERKLNREIDKLKLEAIEALESEEFSKAKQLVDELDKVLTEHDNIVEKLEGGEC